MRILHTTIKMSLVGIITSLVTRELGLEYWLTAGIVGLLSISMTKRDSLYSSARRVVDAIFGLMLSTLMFISFGYVFWVYAIFYYYFLRLFRLN